MGVESATAETAYFHTLNARAYYFPSDQDKRLKDVSEHLLELPAEIRARIYDLAFDSNRVAVSASTGCYCASDGTGPYREDHRWLLTDTTGRLRQDAQLAFIKRAIWEVHCSAAFEPFLVRMGKLGGLSQIRHLRVSVFEETSGKHWSLPLDQLSNLKSLTFAPWQKGWTIDVAAKDGSDQLTDAAVMVKVKELMKYKHGYGPVTDLIETRRGYYIHFVFPIRYLLPGKVLPYRWQLKNWRANMDTGVIDRRWKEIYLVQEATLD